MPPTSPPLPPQLKEVLACPRCKGDLEFREAEGQIRCQACRLAYRIDDGIPVMLVDEAESVADPEHERLMAKVASAGLAPTFAE